MKKINIKPETLNKIKENAATTTSSAAGALAGVILGTALTPEPAAAQETQKPTIDTPDKPVTPVNPVTPVTPPTPEPPVPPTPPTPEPPVPPTPPTPEPEVEVIAYERVDNGDGTQSDIVVLNVNGNEVGVIDVDLDGNADLIISDLNGNGIIEENEVENVMGMNIKMEPLIAAAPFEPGPCYDTDSDNGTSFA